MAGRGRLQGLQRRGYNRGCSVGDCVDKDVMPFQLSSKVAYTIRCPECGDRISVTIDTFKEGILWVACTCGAPHIKIKVLKEDS